MQTPSALRGRRALIARAVLLCVTMYLVTTLAILRLVSLPEIPLLRYVALALPAFASAMLVAYWLELGAPWPAVSLRWESRPRHDRDPTPRPQPMPSRAG